MFCTGSENRAGNHKAMVPQFWWSIIVAKDQCALNHSNRAITSVEVKITTQSTVSDPFMGAGEYIQMETVSVWDN